MRCRLIRICTIFSLLVLLGACSDIWNPPKGGASKEEATVSETGTVLLSIGSLKERTIFPLNPVFATYEFSFEALEGQPGHAAVAVNANAPAPAPVELRMGHWNVIARGYVSIAGISGIPDGDYCAAEDRVLNVLVAAGASQNLSFDLHGGIEPGVDGILSWEFPEDATSGSLELHSFSGVLVKTIDLASDGEQGEIAVASGYYLAVLSLNGGEPKVEALHVYANMVSRVDWAAYAQTYSFTSLNALSVFLSNAPPNTANTPYHIVLTGLDIEADLTSVDLDPLGNLFGALSNGKYVSLDLSGVTGNDLPDITSSVALGSGRSTRTMITSIILPEGIESIGSYAFGWCTSLTNIDIPEGVTSIGNYAFLGCEALVSIDLPDSVTSIGNDAFGYCHSLTNINIPDSMTSIGDSAFNTCDALARVDIPHSVTSIGSSAFAGCTALASIDIPDSVASIGNQAFYCCFALSSVTIGNGVTSIADSAFQGCTALASINIPDGVNSIGEYVFQGCTALATITIGNSVTSIGEMAISNENLLDIIVNTGNETYSSINGILYNKTGTSLLVFPGGRAGTFTIPDSVISIGDYAFLICTALTSIIIPDSVTSIGDFAFEFCTSLISVSIGDGVVSIGDAAFMGCTSLASIDIPDSMSSIGDNAFYSCTSLASVAIGDGVTSIGGGAFISCTSLASIDIPDSVTSIGDYAFAGCYALSSVTFEGAISSGNFSASNPFPGDLRDKYFVALPTGEPGTYTTANPGNSAVWTKQP